MNGPFEVTRLLQNPLGEPAPPGARGDIVRVSDGTASVYLTPAEYEAASEAELRYMLARQFDDGGQALITAADPGALPDAAGTTIRMRDGAIAAFPAAA